MVSNDSGTPPKPKNTPASLAVLLSNLSLTKSPPSCDADVYLTEPDILTAYQSSLTPPLSGSHFANSSPILAMAEDLESVVVVGGMVADMVPRLLAVAFEHAFSAVCDASVLSQAVC